MNLMDAYLFALFEPSFYHAGSTKRLLEQQEAAFAYLTPLAVWIQNQAPVSSKKADEAEKLRDDVRREVAVAWNADIGISGQS
jgi:hypothetical protein